MRVGRLAGIGLWIALATASTASAQVPIEVTAANTTVTQNFNGLAVSGSSNTTLPAGWGFAEAGSGANTTYAAGDGSSSTGNTYSFGTGTSTDRALGEVSTTTVQSTVGVAIHNSTGALIPAVLLGYSGEEWRLGDSAAPIDKLDFQYGPTATALNSGTFFDVDELDFSAPNNGAGSVGALNGNSGGNRTLFSPVWIPANVPDGAVLWIRWVPFNPAGANDGLAIDDLTLTTLQGDGDHDGVPDTADNCPAAGNQDQADTDGDGQGDACDLDDDGDGAPDATDNCPAANPDQADVDGDGQGDACDVDDDGDGLVDASDQCPTQAGPVESHGCPATSQPDDTACDDAKAALAKAKAKLRKLKKHDASKHAIAKAKKKVKKAKAKVKAACAGAKSAIRSAQAPIAEPGW
jgi:hypothetical protein